MHSFSTLSILFTAALSVFTNAAPISPSGVNLGDALSTPQLSGVPNTGGLNLRAADTVVSGAVQSIESKVTSLNTREDSPSVAVIFSNVITEITPYTEQLTYLVPENATVAIITPIVASIKCSIVAAIPQLQALVGQEVSIILAPVEGDVTLTVTELAKIIGSVLCLIFTALGAVLKVVVGEVSSDVLPILTDLGCTITELLEVVVTLVGGIVACLVPLLAPIVGVLSVLELNDFAALLGLSL
ncbi:hypothetical protein PAXINDRAFT_155375 [Paxillus involutus ATCC 200175]|uniref:Uncharacterized protein n=1 Tax=Paxillus involutus ATCC 200175 TaxID=664439 RepID=A0A0C9TZG3_PAXIN|nr:hypothetical protein PAXINDRAFT_155375 [Paxillus involutus ATCC 200175]